MTIRTNAKARVVIEAVQEECQRLGVTWKGLYSGGKHYRALLVIDGKERHLSIVCSPSDTNAALRKCGDLRKLVRSVRGVHSRPAQNC